MWPVFDHEAEHDWRWTGNLSVAAKIGCLPQTLKEWVKNVEIERGTDMAETMKALERKNYELR
jgi:transposase